MYSFVNKFHKCINKIVGGNIMSVLKSKRDKSRADFVSKYSIALKEANETSFWLRKLYTGNHLTQKEFDSINNDCNEIIYILIAIVRKMKENGL